LRCRLLRGDDGDNLCLWLRMTCSLILRCSCKHACPPATRSVSLCARLLLHKSWVSCEQRHAHRCYGTNSGLDRSRYAALSELAKDVFHHADVNMDSIITAKEFYSWAKYARCSRRAGVHKLTSAVLWLTQQT